MAETLEMLHNRRAWLYKEVQKVEAEIAKHPETIARYFEARADLQTLICQIETLASYSEVEDWKEVYSANGYCFTFKDAKKTSWYGRYLDTHHGSHHALDQGGKHGPKGRTPVEFPEWFYEGLDPDEWYAKVLELPRHEAVYFCLMAKEGY